MFSHVTLGTNDLAQAKTFYDAVVAVVGGDAGTIDPVGQRIFYRHNGGMLLVTKPVNGEPATGANGGTIGFLLSSPEQVDAWHAAGVANGGTTCEDPPGKREGSNYYLAYLRDPAGNKLCGLHSLA